MSKVFLLPGILASDLFGVVPLGLRLKYYYNAPAVLVGALDYLRLQTDGRTPFYPSTLPIVPGVLLPSPLGTMQQYLVTQGWEAVQLAYDWRSDLLVSAPAVYAQMKASAGAELYAIIGHSMGGLLARLIWRLAVQDGTAAQIQRIVTLGTPHWGSYSTVGNLAHQGIDYAITALSNAAAGVTLNDVLSLIRDGNGYGNTDAILASWPSFYLLFPNLAEPNAPPDPGRPLLYSTATYGGINGFTEQNWMNSARALGAAFADGSTQPPDTKLLCVRGTGTWTAAAWNESRRLNAPGAYLYADGDGYVTTNSATLRAQALQVHATHRDLPNNPAVLQLVNDWLLHGVPPDPPVVELPGRGRNPTDTPVGTALDPIAGGPGLETSAYPVFFGAPSFCPGGPGANPGALFLR